MSKKVKIGKPDSGCKFLQDVRAMRAPGGHADALYGSIYLRFLVWHHELTLEFVDQLYTMGPGPAKDEAASKAEFPSGR